MAAFKFEELEVYQRSLDVLDAVYVLTEKFPKSEVFNLSSQLKRACLSISLNIAEGSGSTNVNFKRFLNISLNSLNECVVYITVARRRDYITEHEEKKLRESFLIIAKMITNLKKYLIKESGQLSKN